MYLTDFVFDNVKLSMLGYIVGSAVTSNNDSSSAGSKLELNTIMNRGNHINQIISASYNEPITATFDIIKHACNNNAYETVEDTEISYMMTWLNRTEYCTFYPIYDDLSLPNIFFKGTFTEINTIQIGGNVIGFTLTFTASTPYGFADYEDNEFEFMSGNKQFIFYDQSDEYGYHYPDKIIITNKNNDNGTVYVLFREGKNIAIINNCVYGEIITLDCIHKIITSSENHPTLYKDFTYSFPRFFKSTSSSSNTLYSMYPAHIKIIYKPIKKVGIIV